MVLQAPQQIPPLPFAARIRRGYMAASLLLIATITVIIIILFTGFQFKGPIIRVNRINFDKLEAVLAANRTNFIVTAIISVRNPNYLASFKYGNTTTTLLYGGAMVGEAHGPPGKAIARWTTRMHVTVEIMADRILGQPKFEKDMGSGMMRIQSETWVGGRVEMIMVVKKHVVVEINCNVDINITSKWKIQHHNCKRKIKL